jgi:hypothetical protein
MEPLCSEPPDFVQITMPSWVYNRIAALLANAGEYVDDERIEEYVAAVLQGHLRRLGYE